MSYKIASPLASYTVDELVSSKAGPQGTAAYDEMVYDPVAQDRLSAEFSLSLEVSAEIITVILVDLSGSTGQGIGQAWPSGESYSMADLFYEEVKALVRALPNRDVVILGYGSYNGDGWLGEKHGRYTRRLSLDRDESWHSMGGTIPISSELIQAIHTKLGGYGTSTHTPIQIINISDGLPMDYLPLNLSLSAETFGEEFGAQTEAKRALKLLRRKSSKQRTQNRKQARKVKADKYGSEERANYYREFEIRDELDTSGYDVGDLNDMVEKLVIADGGEKEWLEAYGYDDWSEVNLSKKDAINVIVGLRMKQGYTVRHGCYFCGQASCQNEETDDRSECEHPDLDEGEYFWSAEGFGAETDSSKGFIADAKYGAGATFGVIGALFTGGFLMSLLGRRS